MLLCFIIHEILRIKFDNFKFNEFSQKIRFTLCAIKTTNKDFNDAMKKFLV